MLIAVISYELSFMLMVIIDKYVLCRSFPNNDKGLRNNAWRRFYNICGRVGRLITYDKLYTTLYLYTI